MRVEDAIKIQQLLAPFNTVRCVNILYQNKMFSGFRFVSKFIRPSRVLFQKQSSYAARYLVLIALKSNKFLALDKLIITPILYSIVGVTMASAGIDTIIQEVDKLFDEAKYDELFELLKKQDNLESNAKLLWRLARCEFQLSKQVKNQKAEHEQLVNSAYDHVKKSLELDGTDGLAHKWAAILLDAYSSLKGTKERVLQVLNVRNHMEKAIEFAPNDATSYYLLGEWHFSCYQVSWWERKIASIAFGKLPDADMEVALKMFEKAEEVEKDFYSKNKLMLAKTLFELKRDKERSVELLNEVVSKYSNSEKWDDKEVST